MSMAQVKVRFDAEEALADLERLALLQQPQERGKGTGFRAVPPKEAYGRVKAYWDELLTSRMGAVRQILQD